MYYDIESLTDMILSVAGEAPREAFGELHEGEWEGVTLRRRVRDLIEGVAADVILRSPASQLEDVRQLSRDICWRGDGSGRGWILLPDDFLRLVSFRMSDWPFAVSFAEESSPEMLMRQHGPWRGLRGSPERPVCLLSTVSFGRILEFFSSFDDKASVADATYVAYPRISPAETIPIPSRLLPSVISAIIPLLIQS